MEGLISNDQHVEFHMEACTAPRVKLTEYQDAPVTTCTALFYSFQIVFKDSPMQTAWQKSTWELTNTTLITKGLMEFY